MGLQEDMEQLVTEDMIRINKSGPWPPTNDAPDNKWDMLAPTDIPYFQIVMAQHAEAQQHLTQAGQLEQQAAALRAEAQAKIGAHNSYVQHLFEKYHLTPGQDRIEPHGNIVRSDQPQPAR
jgi:hypothetical protein